MAANKLEYMDSMQESLNKEIKESGFPNWRNHASLKGKKSHDHITAITLFLCRMDFDELSDDCYKPVA